MLAILEGHARAGSCKEVHDYQCGAGEAHQAQRHSDFRFEDTY